MVGVTGDAHITRVLGMEIPKTQGCLYQRSSSPQSLPVLSFDLFMRSSFPFFMSYTLNVTMALDKAEIKCSNKYLKINAFVKHRNIGPVWELLTPGLLMDSCHICLITNLLINLSIDIEI